MILFTHISLAIASLIYTPYLYLYPSKAKLRFGYGILAVAFASGVYLVWGKPANLIQTCIIGLVYFGIILFGLQATKNKLARTAKEPLEKI